MILKLKDYKFLKGYHELKITELEKRLMVHRELLKDADKNIEELTQKEDENE